MQRIICVGDDIEEIKRAVREGIAWGYDLILTTGGLGPTSDDLTIEAIAEALGLRVVIDDRSLAILKRRLEERYKAQGTSLELTPRRLKMATIVQGATPIDNPVGLAPAMELRVGKTLIISFPGIPEEMKAIFEGHVLPIIDKMSARRVIATTLRIALSGEHLAEVVREMEKAFTAVYVKTYAGNVIPGLGTRTDILIEGTSEDECRQILEKVLEVVASSVSAKGGTWQIE
jgi:molybdenum cofactor synthesis domain-containing protein